jgi:hypothetical protein
MRGNRPRYVKLERTGRKATEIDVTIRDRFAKQTLQQDNRVLLLG